MSRASDGARGDNVARHVGPHAARMDLIIAENSGGSTMNRRVYGTRMGLSVGLSVAGMLTGCAAIQRSEARSTEQLLAAAGFVVRPAATAGRQQHLAALPPDVLDNSTEGGTVLSL